MAKSAQKKKPDRYVRDSGLMEKQVTIDGKRKVFRGHSEREINEKMLRYQTEQAAGPMLSDVAESWWAQKEATLRPGTVRCYSMCLQRIIPVFGSRRMREIRAQDVMTFLEQLRARGLARKTMHNTHCVLNMIFEHWCAAFGGDANPSRLVTTPTGPKTVRKPPTAAQQAAILREIHSGTGGGEIATGALAAAVMIYTGARLGEAVGLQWGDVDFDARRIFIRRAAEWNGGNHAALGAPKTENGFRVLPLLPQLDVLLRPRRGTADRFILGDGDKPLTSSAFQCAWVSFCRACGLTTTTERRESRGSVRTIHHPIVTPHQLRHCFATELKKAGVDMDVAVRMMGHADSTMIRRVYMDIDGELLATAGEQLSAHMASKYTRGTHDDNK